MQQDSKIGIVLLVLAIFALCLAVYVNLFNSFNFLADPNQGGGLGNLCSNEQDCYNFCQNNRGRCVVYCTESPENELCNTLIGNRRAG